jgi:hypothetical protein
MIARTMLALSLGFGGVILAAQIARAEPQCGPREMVLQSLADRYSETRRSLGLAGPTQMMELFANDATGTWTITLTMPDGVTCMVASGQGFQTLDEARPARGTPT